MTDSSAVRVGVDVGGTFTDVVTVSDGQWSVTKVPSTPDAQERGVLDGLESAVDDAGRDPTDVEFVGHGTTVATNAVLEREWAETALVTTEGFRDALEIGRQTRPDIYDFDAEKPTPIVPRHRRYEVGGRLDERGRVVDPLDQGAIEAVSRELARDDVESVAVVFLFAFENDDHERAVAETLADRLDAPVSLSSRVHPEIREYERTVVTCLNAALSPVVDEYVGNLGDGLAAGGVSAPLRLMGSNGGLMTADAARERPVRTLLSGPAAGVKGAVHVAERSGVGDDVITMDMGGTSCDVSLVRDGDPVVSTDVEVGEYPVALPMLDVHTVGSGGGSVAWIDAGGALRVGPRSAGARPGPVCYGRGGEEPTITDAHCVLGRIDPRGFVEEADDAALSAAREAIADLGDDLGSGPVETARGVVAVANANMERALRVVSVERGHDPRDFALVTYGGAGPLHGTALARSLDVPRVLVPRAAGVLSALGLLVSDVSYDLASSWVRPLSAVEPTPLREQFASLESRGRDRLAEESVPEERWHLERSVDLRYRGQSFELQVSVPEYIDDEALATVADRFHERHERRYGHASPDEPIELVTVRVRARATIDPPEHGTSETAGSVADAVTGTRDVVFEGEPRETRVFDRDRLPGEAEVEGPAVVEGAESTVVVHPGQVATVDADGNIVVEVDS